VKLDEIASRISAHLKRFEGDPKTNIDRSGRGLFDYYGAHATRAGSYVSVTYISYQGSRTLRKDEALAYLAWLDAGGVGTHYTAEYEQRALKGGRA
jgi:hypothetical protein